MTTNGWIAKALCLGLGAATSVAVGAFEPLTPAARQTYERVVAARDNASVPFIVIDKAAARLWLFDVRGDPRGSTPVLLGAGRGDRSVPGIGQRAMEKILPHERTTPAGRFVAERGLNLSGEDIIWIDYDAAVSLHRVRATQPSERRLQRLASKTPHDNRISYGCINVPVAFYDRWLAPLALTTKLVVYVLPEEHHARVFAWSRPARDWR